MTTNNTVNTTLSGQTGTGNFVGSTSPTLVTPALGTPSSGTLTNCTGLPVAGGGTGDASFTAYAVIAGGTSSTNPLQSIASVGTSGQVLTSNGAGALPTFQPASAASNILVQYVQTTSNSKTTTSTVIPPDNTIPQNTEGAEYITLAITPTNSSNLLLIEFISYGSVDGLNTFITALFQDTTANALNTTAVTNGGAGYTVPVVLRHIMTAGTTSSTTFKVRYGPGTSANAYMNQSSNGPLFSTSSLASFTIYELKV